MSPHGGKTWNEMTKNEKLARSTTFHKEDLDKNLSDLANADFSHLHNHSQFSVLQSSHALSLILINSAVMNLVCISKLI